MGLLCGSEIGLHLKVRRALDGGKPLGKSRCRWARSYPYMKEAPALLVPRDRALTIVVASQCSQSGRELIGRERWLSWARIFLKPARRYEANDFALEPASGTENHLFFKTGPLSNIGSISSSTARLAQALPFGMRRKMSYPGFPPGKALGAPRSCFLLRSKSRKWR